MTDISPEIKEIIKRCQADPRFFISKFCKVKHPTAGIIPFKLFSYQKKCLEEFKEHRFNIFRKTRQCFAGNTPVWTVNGPVLIKDLHAGDSVLTYDINNDKIKSSKIHDVFNNGFAKCYELETVNGHKLTLTGDHELLTKNNGWKKVDNLDVDDYLVEFIDNSRLRMIDGSLTKVHEFVKIKGFISSIKRVEKELEVFDLNVPPYHNYITDGIVAHNCGISTLSGAYALWVAMFHNAKTILVVSKRDEDAMNFLNKNIKFVYDYLPKWMKEIWPVEQNQHKIMFSSNSSSIQSLTSSPDTLRSNSSTLNIIDEAAFIDCMDVMWTGGWSCVAGDTIINVDGALRNIDTIGDKNGNEWQDVNIKVQSDASIKDSDKFFINGYTDTYKITTLCGYSIECTGNHRLKDDNYNWIYTKDIKIGDKLALKVGNDFSDKEFDDGLELIKHKQIEYLSNGIITKIVDDKLEVVKLEVDGRGIFYDGVVRIEKSKNYTYDLSVPSGNTYIANGFVSHNTLTHGGCLSNRTLILNANGLNQISSFHKDKNVSWEDYDGVAFTDVGQNKISKSYYNGIAKTKKITTKDGYYIESTNEHKFRIIDENGEYVWRKVEDLKLDDELVLSCKPANFKKESIKLNHDIYNQYDHGCKMCGKEYMLDRKVSKIDEGFCSSCITTIRMLNKKSKDIALPETLTERFAEFLGIMNGDGFCDMKVGRIGVSCNRTHTDYIAYLHVLMKELFSVKICEEISYKDYSVRFHSKKVLLFLKKNNLLKNYADNVQVPEIILSSDDKIKCAFLKGLFETDGSISKSMNQVSLSSSSIDLIRTVQTILLSLGLRSRLYVISRKNGFSDKLCYSLSLKSKKDVVLFREKIGFISKHKNDRLINVKFSGRAHNDNYTNREAIDDFYIASVGMDSKIRQEILHRKTKSLSRFYINNLISKYQKLNNTTLGFLGSNDLFTDKIIKLEDSECETYDLTVDNSNTYIANGFISHNSCITISTCVSGDTLIKTPLGLVEIGEISKGLEFKKFDDDYDIADIVMDVHTDSGFRKTTKLYRKNNSKILKITTDHGHELKCDEDHAIMSSYGWINVKNLRNNDYIPVSTFFYTNNNSNNIRFEKISKIEMIQNSECTYDFTVPGKESFLTNGFISHNTNGLGNWYANTWQDAIDNKNDFNPIDINWWDMDWEIKYDLNGKTHTVSPIAGIRKLTEPDEISKYGPYWSPWLESQYRGLVEKGNDSKFRQEVLCVSGNTKINTISGFVEIKNIKVGDEVLTHYGRFKKVTQVGSRDVQPNENIYKFYSKNGDFNEFISGNHPIYSIDSWKTLDELNTNIGEIDTISICKFQGELSAELNIVKFIKNNYDGLLYNIEVEDDHTYCTRHCILHNCEFLGTGNTVLSREQLGFVSQTVNHEYKTVKIVEYVNPVTGERCNLDFVDSLHIWKEPIHRERWCTRCSVKPEKINVINREPYCTVCNNIIVLRAHSYVLGADISSGEANDFSTIQVIDIVDKEQVAELKIKALPKEFSRMIDYVGRKYNDALAVVERDGIGRPIISELHETLCYPNLYRDQKVAARTLKKVQSYIGYSTGPSNKPVLNRALLDMIGDDDDYIIRSNRLLKEFHIYMYLNGSNRTGAQPGEGNNDDLVISFALALIGAQRIDGASNNSITPYYKYSANEDEDDNKNKVKISDFMVKGGRNVLLPSAISQDVRMASIEEQLYNFTSKLGGLPMDRNGFPVGMPASVNKQKNLKRK